jgi:magnesium transporter
MFFPQVSVMKLLEYNLNKLFKWEMEEYFEDLEDKLEYIVTDIKILQEYIDWVEDAYKSIIDIKTNNIMTFLTIFSVFLLPLTLITSFYWMNITPLPFDNIYFIYIMLILSIIIMILLFYILRKKWKI